MKQAASIPGLTLFAPALASASAETPTPPAKPEPTSRIALWAGKAPVGDGTFENQADRSQ
jgi:hypothetical protein